MTGIEILALLLLVAAVTGLVSFVRHDRFTSGPARRDELGQPLRPMFV